VTDAKAQLVQNKSRADQAVMGIAPLKQALQKKELEAKKTKGDYEKSAGSTQKIENEINVMTVRIFDTSLFASDESVHIHSCNHGSV
jgi:hypothetical protein